MGGTRTLRAPGGELARLRLESGLSAQMLADRAGVNRSSVLRAENGHAVTPEVMNALARVLGQEVHALTMPAHPAPDGAPVVLKARIVRKLTRVEAARLAGVSPDVLARAERGLGVHPRNAKRIALAYGLKVADVLPSSDDNGDTEAA